MTRVPPDREVRTAEEACGSRPPPEHSPGLPGAPPREPAGPLRFTAASPALGPVASPSSISKHGTEPGAGFLLVSRRRGEPGEESLLSEIFCLVIVPDESTGEGPNPADLGKQDLRIQTEGAVGHLPGIPFRGSLDEYPPPADPCPIFLEIPMIAAFYHPSESLPGPYLARESVPRWGSGPRSATRRARRGESPE